MKRSTAKRFLPPRRVFGYVLAVSPGVISAFFLTSVVLAQASPDLQELVRLAVGNELGLPFLAENCTYQYHRELSGKHETLQMVKSDEGLLVGKVVRVDNVPVSEDRARKEDDQLQHLLNDSSAQQQQRRRQQRVEHYIRELIQAMPQAFHYTETKTEMAADGGRLIHLAFQPAPDYHPPSAELEVMRGLSGVMVIHEQRKRILRLEAHLFREIDFGWGILIQVNKGGNLLLEREPASPPGSDVRVFSLNIDGRILLLKKLEIHWSFDHFACLPRALDLASAVSLLTAPDGAGSSDGLPSR
ncbi:MAG TPA: hypothetical protein VEI52_03255 [Terriglobales bacterium]|nr:hypothetical protein [Terriglobales bacterium]